MKTNHFCRVTAQSDVIAGSDRRFEMPGVISSTFLAAQFRYQTHNVIKRSILILLAVGFVIAFPPVYAQKNPAPSHVSKQNASPFDPAAATKTWLATVPQDKREKSDDYF